MPSTRQIRIIRQYFLLTIFLPLFFAGYALADFGGYNEALDAYNNKNYETALPIWRRLAAEGDANAQYALGVAYFKGEGVSRDITESMKWFEQAAESGNVQAMFNLGAAHWEGNGTRQSYAEAVEWWEKSAAAGQSAAQYNLGLAYYLGKGTEQDLNQALKWIRQAAESSHNGAQEVLVIIEKELAQIATREIETPQPKTPQPNEVDIQGEVAETTEKKTTISAEFQSAVVSGHGGQAYPTQDESGAVLANLAAGIPIKILNIDGDWARVNLPAVANVWVYGKYVIGEQGNHRIKGARVRARSHPSTGEDSLVVGLFEPDEPVILLTRREQWKQVAAPSRIPLWIPIQQLEIFPDVTNTWMKQWQQALSGPTSESLSNNNKAPDTKSAVNDKQAVSSVNQSITTANVSTNSFRAAFVSAASAEMLGNNNSRAPLLKLVLRGTPIKIIDQQQEWARVQIPSPLNVWVYGRYVNQQGDTARIQGEQVRARSMPSTSSSSAILGIFEENTQVTVISKEGDWIRISVRDVVAAWVQIQQLQILDKPSEDWWASWNATRNNL
uniref:FOG: TPR repeat, SEL1 subfamily n=1 Tax=uncultured gamma proteobacterium HF0200_24F15 TaxID=723570 RepID=E7C3Z1_9GAMM|nr:FOG: TPR repeat, SEL1 subfamily [uncultured gamma proteobacterium HF0200_24F15]